MALRRRMLVAVAACALLLPVLPATTASAADVSASSSAAAIRGDDARDQVLQVAASLQGVPYVPGGTTPSGFDCSGYTSYVYRTAVGVELPRVSRDQYAAAEHITRAEARPGDLVFFHRNGRVYHAAIYAGGNAVWHSPYPGKVVSKERIWTSSVYFARVL